MRALVRVRKSETETDIVIRIVGIIKANAENSDLLSVNTGDASPKRCIAVWRRSARIFVKVKDRAKNSTRTHGGSVLENHLLGTLTRFYAPSREATGSPAISADGVTLHVALIEIIVAQDAEKKTENDREIPSVIIPRGASWEDDPCERMIRAANEPLSPSRDISLTSNRKEVPNYPRISCACFFLPFSFQFFQFPSRDSLRFPISSTSARIVLRQNVPCNSS